MVLQRVVVTGGAGFIGRNLVGAIAQHRPEALICIADRRPAEQWEELA